MMLRIQCRLSLLGRADSRCGVSERSICGNGINHGCNDASGSWMSQNTMMDGVMEPHIVAESTATFQAPGLISGLDGPVHQSCGGTRRSWRLLSEYRSAAKPHLDYIRSSSHPCKAVEAELRVTELHGSLASSGLDILAPRRSRLSREFTGDDTRVKVMPTCVMKLFQILDPR